MCLRQYQRPTKQNLCSNNNPAIMQPTVTTTTTTTIISHFILVVVVDVRSWAGRFPVLWDFSPLQCSVLLIVTVVPAAFESLISSFSLVLGWSITFLVVIFTSWDIILELQPEDDCWCDYSEMEKSITISHRAPCWWSCRPFQPVCRSKIWSLIPFDSSLVSPVVMERLEWKKLILWSGVLYTPNKLLSVNEWLIDCYQCGSQKSVWIVEDQILASQWHAKWSTTFM